MNRYVVALMATLLLLAPLTVACMNNSQFSDVLGREWQLAQVRVKPENININRDKLAEEGFSGIFTLRFDEERISGVGAPNRYFAPYALSDKQGLAIENIAGTLMAAISEPEELKEHEFFTLLRNTYRWNLAGKNLELHTKGENGSEAVLVFTSSP